MTQEISRLAAEMEEKIDFEPGSYGCHEALHMASFLADAVSSALMDHKAIQQNKEWVALAAKAHRALFDLYQKIGAKHL